MRPRPDVLVVGTVYPTVGGIASVIEDQVRELERRGQRVQLLNTGRRRRERPGSPSIGNAVASLFDAVRVAAACAQSKPRLVAVHTVASPLPPALRAIALVAAARATGRPVVTHIHAYDIEATIEAGGPRFAAAIARLARWSSEVVVLHDRVAAGVRTVAPEARVVLLPNCVECERYRPLREPPSGPPRLVFVGTAGRRKGVDVLLAALPKVVHPFVCDVAGGPAEEDPAFHDQLTREGVPLVQAGRLVFHGEIDRDQALALLQRAALFVLPSRAEGMPVALLEAMACGVASVVTPVGAMGDVVQSAGCGAVVPVGDAGALAAAIDSLLGDDERRKVMGAAGRSAVLARHCCDSVGDALAGLYQAASR